DRPGGAQILKGGLGPGVQTGKGDADMKAIEQNIEKEIAQAVMEEQPMQPPAPKRKKMLTESTAAKVIAFLLMLVMTAVTAGGVLGAVFLYSADVY
ncbi:Co-chaperonin GroES (HSP10), partial [Dysosmobacter welbionis]